MSKCCSTCKHWHLFLGADDTGLHQCRRFPPAYEKLPTYMFVQVEPSPPTIPTFPFTGGDWYCGEYSKLIDLESEGDKP